MSTGYTRHKVYYIAIRLRNSRKALEEQARDLAYQAYEQFGEKLTTEQKEAFDHLMDLYLDGFLCRNKEAFIQGARAGAQILLDLLAGSL